MSDELKVCPFCGNIGNRHKEDCYFSIQNRPEYPSLYILEGLDAWNTRPIEDVLQAKLDVAVEAMKLARYDVRINTHASLMRPILEEALKRLEA